MGLGKPQRLAKFEVAGFIYYGNIRNLFSKIQINQYGDTPYFGGKLTLPLDSQTQCFLFNVQLLSSYDYSKRVIFTKKTHFTMKNFKFWGPVKWGLKIFAPNYQKAHPFAKSGRTNRMAYVAVTLF